MDELQITKGAETLDYDQDNYRVKWGQFAPKTSIRDRGFLGGSAYANSAEDWRIRITGASGPAAHDNADDLARIIESARDWWDGVDPDVVVLSYQPPNSTLSAALSTVIIGAQPGREVCQLPGDFDASGETAAIDDVIFRFLRRGAWLLPAEQQDASAVDVPGEMVATFGTAVKNLSPFDLTLRGFNSNADDTFELPAGILFVYQDSTDCWLDSLHNNALTSFFSHADSSAVSGAVARLAGASGLISQAFDLTNVTGKHLGVFMSYHNTDASTAWTVTTTIDGQTSLTINPSSNKVSIPAGNTEKQMITLGYLNRANDESNITINFSRTAGSGAIECDYMVVVDLDKLTTYIVETGKYEGEDDAFTAVLDLAFDSGALTLPAAKASIKLQSSGADIVAYNTRGDLAFHMQGTTVRARFCAPGANNGNHWITEDNDGIFNPVMRINRYAAYMVPQ